MKPKLLCIAPQNPYPPIDGGKISIYYPVIYSSNYFDVFFSFLYNPEEIDINIIKNHFFKFNIKVISFPHNIKSDVKYLLKNFFKKEPFKWDKYYSLKFQQMLTEVIKKEKINYLWISHPHMAKYGIELKKQFPYLRIFLREHNIEFKLIEQFKNFVKNPLYKFISYWQFKKTKKLEIEYWYSFDKVFFISDLDYAIAKEIAPEICEKFEVLYDGYEVKNLEISSLYKNNSFIYTANLKTIQNSINFKWFIKNIWIPNLEIIKRKNIKLYVTGNPENLLKKTLGIHHIKSFNIINLGFVEDINNELLKHKYVLSPTIMGSGLRLKILNGMACGKPVFLTPLDLSTCKIFKDMENVVCFQNENDFLKKLCFLEENNELYLKISKKALETVKAYFDWNKYAEKIYELFIDKNE